MNEVARDIGKKLADDIHMACKRNVALVDGYQEKLGVLRLGSCSVLAWLAAGICETDDGSMGTPADDPPDEAIWLAAFLMARELTGHSGDNVKAAFDDVEVWKRLGRIASPTVTSQEEGK